MFKDPVEGKVLPGHVIRTEKVANVGSCRKKCFLEPNCESINVGPADHQGQRTCELNDFRDESPSQTKLEEKTGHFYCSIEVTHYSNINNNISCEGFRNILTETIILCDKNKNANSFTLNPRFIAGSFFLPPGTGVKGRGGGVLRCSTSMTYNFKTPHEKATKTKQNNGEVISSI